MASIFNSGFIFVLNLIVQTVLFLAVHQHIEALDQAAVFGLAILGLVLSGLGSSFIYALWQSVLKPTKSFLFFLYMIGAFACGFHSIYILYLMVGNLLKNAPHLH